MIKILKHVKTCIVCDVESEDIISINKKRAEKSALN